MNGSLIVLMHCTCLLFQLLRDEITKHKDKVQNINETAEAFRVNNHFMAPKLCDRAKKIKVR